MDALPHDIRIDSHEQAAGAYLGMPPASCHRDARMPIVYRPASVQVDGRDAHKMQGSKKVFQGWGGGGPRPVLFHACDFPFHRLQAAYVDLGPCPGKRRQFVFEG